MGQATTKGATRKLSVCLRTTVNCYATVDVKAGSKAAFRKTLRAAVKNAVLEPEYSTMTEIVLPDVLNQNIPRGWIPQSIKG